MAEYIIGNLLTFECDVIIQQCNCITVNPKGLALSVSAQLGVDVYKTRMAIGKKNLCISQHRDIPGKCIITKCWPGSRPKYVASLMAQFAPGKPRSYYKNVTEEHGYDDDSIQRIEWFKKSLEELKSQIVKNDFKTIAFPKGIGCGMAGGDWKIYSKIIEDFSISLGYDVKVYVVQL